MCLKLDFSLLSNIVAYYFFLKEDICYNTREYVFSSLDRRYKNAGGILFLFFRVFFPSSQTLLVGRHFRGCAIKGPGAQFESFSHGLHGMKKTQWISASGPTWLYTFDNVCVRMGRMKYLPALLWCCSVGSMKNRTHLKALRQDGHRVIDVNGCLLGTD